MDNFKTDQYYLQHISTNLKFIVEKMLGISMEDFSKNEILQDSMMFRLIQISEDSSKLTIEYREKHSSIPWGDIYGLRNRIVHDYGHVDLKIVYDTLVIDIPWLFHSLVEGQ